MVNFDTIPITYWEWSSTYKQFLKLAPWMAYFQPKHSFWIDSIKSLAMINHGEHRSEIRKNWQFQTLNHWLSHEMRRSFIL